MRVLAAAFVVIASISCARGTSVANCPGQENPRGKTDAELDASARRSVPEKAAVTRESVNWTVHNRRAYLERNFRDVEAVGAGDGFGISYTLDKFGKATYHRERDYMIVVTMRNKTACPDTIEGGTLFVFGRDGDRVPVRFVYPKT